jgi:hypothetical protein
MVLADFHGTITSVQGGDQPQLSALLFFAEIFLAVARLQRSKCTGSVFGEAGAGNGWPPKESF